MSETPNISRRTILAGAAAGVVAIAGVTSVVVFTGGDDEKALIDAAVAPLLKLLPDRPAAQAIGTAAVPVLGVPNQATLVRDLSGDLEIDVAQFPAISEGDLHARFMQALARDSERGAVVMIDGWVVPQTLARLCALTAAKA